ncbi:hypothetical protein [Streptomyces sp. NPDC002644]
MPDPARPVLGPRKRWAITGMVRPSVVTSDQEGTVFHAARVKSSSSAAAIGRRSVAMSRALSAATSAANCSRATT